MNWGLVSRYSEMQSKTNLFSFQLVQKVYACHLLVCLLAQNTDNKLYLCHVSSQGVQLRRILLPLLEQSEGDTFMFFEHVMKYYGVA